MGHVRLAAVDHLLLFHDAEQVGEHIDTAMLPDLFQRLKIFSLPREIFVPTNQVFAQIVEVVVEPCNVLAAGHVHSDIAYAERGTVSVLELEAEVHYVEVYLQVAFEPAIDPEIVTFVGVAVFDTAMEHFVEVGLASVAEY